MNLVNDAKLLAALSTEWTEIVERERRQVMGAWARAMDEMVREEARLRSEGKWVRGPVDVFGVLGLSRAEVRHTRFLAWLLDPAGQHGLGAAFLERILARTFPEDTFSDLGRARATPELTRADCRVDVVVEAPSLFLVVEAKVDAMEGHQQCDYQYEQFADEVGARFVFLSPRGRAPRTATGDAAEAYRALSFTVVRDELRASLAAAGPARGRGAAEDYLRTLEREFPWPS